MAPARSSLRRTPCLCTSGPKTVESTSRDKPKTSHPGRPRRNWDLSRTCRFGPRSTGSATALRGGSWGATASSGYPRRRSPRYAGCSTRSRRGLHSRTAEHFRNRPACPRIREDVDRKLIAPDAARIEGSAIWVGTEVIRRPIRRPQRVDAEEQRRVGGLVLRIRLEENPESDRGEIPPHHEGGGDRKDDRRRR